MSSYLTEPATGPEPASPEATPAPAPGIAALHRACDDMDRCETLTELFALLLEDAPRLTGGEWAAMATCGADGALLYVASHDGVALPGPDDWTRILAACAATPDVVDARPAPVCLPIEGGTAGSLLAVPLAVVRSALRYVLVIGGRGVEGTVPHPIQMLCLHAELSLARIVASSELRQSIDANDRIVRITHLVSSLNGSEPPDRVLVAVMDAILRETPGLIAATLHLRPGGRLMHELSRGAVPPALCVGPGLAWWQACLRESVDSRKVDYRSLPEIDGDARLLITVPVRSGTAPDESATLGVLSLFATSLEPVDGALRSSLDPFAHILAQLVGNLQRHRAFERANLELEQRKAQIIESRSALEAILNGFPDGLFIVDRDLRVTLSNEVQAGRARVLAPGASGYCWELYGSCEGVCSGCHIEDTLNKGKSTRHLMRVGRDDALAREWEVATHPIAQGAAKTPQAALVIVRDVTEQQQIAHSLAQVEKLAAVGRLAAGIAHEINNPLAAIQANVQLLQEGVPADDPRYESLAIVRRSAERAHRVVRNLLSFSEVNLDYLAAVDLNATIRTAFELVTHQAELRGIAIDYQLAVGLPEVFASREQIESVWLNLALNALDAILESAAPGRIFVSSEVWGNGWVRVAVRDDGPGIPPQSMARVFEPFAAHASRGAGTGLGLYSCHSVVKRHGGSIRAYPAEGGGTVFEVLLPALPEDVAELDYQPVGGAAAMASRGGS